MRIRATTCANQGNNQYDILSEVVVEDVNEIQCYKHDFKLLNDNKNAQTRLAFQQKHNNKMVNQ